jgi:hypothetical protein
MLQYEIQITVPLGGSNCKISISVAIVLVPKPSICGMDNRAIEKPHASDLYPGGNRARTIVTIVFSTLKVVTDH